MAEPAGPVPRPRLELSLLEARTRFVQLARLASLTQQTTIVTDGGRPLAAIVPVTRPGQSADVAAPGGSHAVAPRGSADVAAPGRSDLVASGGSPDAVAPGGSIDVAAPGRSAAVAQSRSDSVASGGTSRSRPSGDGRPSGGVREAGPMADAGGAPAGSAAGWLRRIETLRAELQRQHTALEAALEEAWRELDRLRPPGSDSAIDALRLAHSDIRRAR